MGCGFSAVPRPSRVTISDVPTALSGVMQERVAFPSIRTVQEPHWPRPQPNLGPRNWSSSPKTYSSGVAGSRLTVCTRPFTFRDMALICFSLSHFEQLFGTDAAFYSAVGWNGNPGADSAHWG